MQINNTNYSAVAEYLYLNYHLIESATSYSTLTKTLNNHFNSKMNTATVSTIVASLHGAIQAQST